MAETEELTVTPTQCGGKDSRAAEVRSRNFNPRAEIDTSPPFGSVEEAVQRFGGKGSWIPHHFLRLAAHHHNGEESDIDKMEEQTAQLEKDLMVKERETLDVLKELDAAKRFVEGFKLNLMKEVSVFLGSPLSSDSQTSIPEERSVESLSLCPFHSPGLILIELNQAKLNLNKTTNDLSIIQASVESLNRKMRNEKLLLEKSMPRETSNSVGMLSVDPDVDGSHDKARAMQQKISGNMEVECGALNSRDLLMQMPQLNFEAEQFRSMTEAAKYEIMKAMLEIKQMKKSIDMVEMRLIAARKMEEAARAIEAISMAEGKALPDYKGSPEIPLQKQEKITLSFEEYSALNQKAQKAEELYKKVADATNCDNEADLSKVSILKRFEETTQEVKRSRRSLEEVMGEIDRTNRRKHDKEEGFCRAKSEHGQMRYPGQNSAKFKFSNYRKSHNRRDSRLLDGDESNLSKDKPMPVLRSTISIGDILSRKLILQDDIMVGKHVQGQNERRDVLSQMLREQSGLILHPPKSMKDDDVEKHFFTQRKKFGFIHVSLPMTRQSKKKHSH